MKFISLNAFVFLLGVSVTACSTGGISHGDGVTSASLYLLRPSDVASFTKRAQRGDSEAAFRLSMHYYALQDPNAGFLWQYIAASQNNPIAQHNMANFNINTYKNIPLAKFWLKEAHRNGLKEEDDYLSKEIDGQ